MKRIGYGLRLDQALHPERYPYRIHFTRKEGGEWEPWPLDSTPKPPRPWDAPFHPAGDGMAQWPTTGVHFHAIRFDDRVWDAVNGWTEPHHQRTD